MEKYNLIIYQTIGVRVVQIQHYQIITGHKLSNYVRFVQKRNRFEFLD